MIVFKIREIEESFFSQNYEVICEKKRFRARMFGLCTEGGMSTHFFLGFFILGAKKS